MFETVYEVKFLQGVNHRPYLYRAYTPNIKTGDTVVVDVNGGGKEYSGYKLAQVVKVNSFHSDTARKYTVKIVAVVDDTYYKEQRQASLDLAEASRKFSAAQHRVDVAEKAVIDLDDARRARNEAGYALQAVKENLDKLRLRRFDNATPNDARYWARTDQDVPFMRGPFPAHPGAGFDYRHTGSALGGLPDPLDDGGWGH